MRIASFLLVILILFLPLGSAAAAAENYVALGDSLAAGQTPYSEIDAGYTDFIAIQLMQSGRLANFTKELAFPGFTTTDVLASIDSERAATLLGEATLITISAGANDLLRLVAHDPQAGTLSFSQLTADFALNQVRMNMEKLLSELKLKAPQANVYVMGYYFPYTSVHEQQRLGTAEQLDILNEILHQQALQAGAEFVDVAKPFAAQATSYLPNVADVHPNQNGYRIMANAFLADYVNSETLNMSEQMMPEPNPISFEQLLGQQMELQPQGTTKEEEKASVSATTVYAKYPSCERPII